MVEMIQSKDSIKNLSPHEYNKWLYFGKRGYEYCAQTLIRIFDYDQAIYDDNEQLFFINNKARNDYYKEKSITKRKRSNAI